MSVLSPSININQALRLGSRGSSVRALQSALNANGVNAGTADGVFGLQTQRAVREFQRNAGITVDGVAGPQTNRALNGSGSSSNSSAKSLNSSTTQSRNNTSVDGIISTAKAQIGTPYQWGGTTPSGFDFSGFMNYAFNQNK
ncbi:C40 family peptidase [Alkalihalobacillus deserti]|uniref:C40 family peptidase n=1 Tax=Alkalihalobacillus deserti TaxID=2879466 RepID=UPI0027E12703|nr:peptidoglycan-binding protein [Alkalihalobacillus deserti]